MSKQFLAALTILLIGGSAHAGNLVQNGSFTLNSLPSSVASSGFDGAEIDPLWHYNGAVTDWSSPDAGYPQVYNLYIPDPSHADSVNADARYTSSEPQHMNMNFMNTASPDGGAFMLLDADPNFTGPLQQTISGLTPGAKYTLSFYWAAGELSNRKGYISSQLTGSFGGDAFATTPFLNSHPYYDNPLNQDGDFSGWQKFSTTFTAHSGSQLLSFLAVGSPAANLPPVALLDGVSLTAVPEPATWALMMIGVAGLGAAARRRRSLALAA
jgi:hypothetical protein